MDFLDGAAVVLAPAALRIVLSMLPFAIDALVFCRFGFVFFENNDSRGQTAV